MRRHRRGVLHVRVGRTTIRAEAHVSGVATWAGAADYASLEELTDTIARLAAEAEDPCRRLMVALERPPAQTRTLVDLPPVKDRELASLVAHQSGRFFRRNGHPLVTDAVWAPNGTGRVVHAAAVEEPVVQAIVAGARAAGLALDGLAPADGPVSLLLLPASERAARARAQRTRMRRLGLATAGVWLIVIGLLIGRLVWERRAIDRELASLQAPLAAVLLARRELREAEATIQAVAGAERARGQSLALLSALTQALPDSAVLTSVTWNSDAPGTLTGYARSGAEVVARMERSGQFGAPRLEGPVMKETFAGREWQRFAVVFGEAAAP